MRLTCSPDCEHDADCPYEHNAGRCMYAAYYEEGVAEYKGSVGCSKPRGDTIEDRVVPAPTIKDTEA